MIRLFAGPKVIRYVIMVYDGTTSVFNKSMWVPKFGMPTVKILLTGTGPDYWMVDLDIGNMF